MKRVGNHTQSGSTLIVQPKLLKRPSSKMRPHALGTSGEGTLLLSSAGAAWSRGRRPRRRAYPAKATRARGPMLGMSPPNLNGPRATPRPPHGTIGPPGRKGSAPSLPLSAWCARTSRRATGSVDGRQGAPATCARQARPRYHAARAAPHLPPESRPTCQRGAQRPVRPAPTAPRKRRHGARRPINNPVAPPIGLTDTMFGASWCAGTKRIRKRHDAKHRHKSPSGPSKSCVTATPAAAAANTPTPG